MTVPGRDRFFSDAPGRPDMGGRIRTTIVLAVTLALFGTMSLLGPLAEGGLSLVLGGLLLFAAVAAGVVRYRNGAGERSGGSVWDAIPGWQYTGRHVELGGLTRDEQEQALREVQEEAARCRRE